MITDKQKEVAKGGTILLGLPRAIRNQLFRDALRFLRDEKSEGDDKCHSVGTVFLNLYSTPAGRFVSHIRTKLRGGEWVADMDYSNRKAVVEALLALGLKKGFLEIFPLQPPMYLITETGTKFLRQSDSLGSMVTAYLARRFS